MDTALHRTMKPSIKIPISSFMAMCWPNTRSVTQSYCSVLPSDWSKCGQTQIIQLVHLTRLLDLSLRDYALNNLRRIIRKGWCLRFTDSSSVEDWIGSCQHTGVLWVYCGQAHLQPVVRELQSTFRTNGTG